MVLSIVLPASCYSETVIKPHATALNTHLNLKNAMVPIMVLPASCDSETVIKAHVTALNTHLNHKNVMVPLVAWAASNAAHSSTMTPALAPKK